MSINNGIENINNVLNRNVSLKDNVFCIVKDVQVSVDSVGNVLSQIGFPVDLKTQIIGISVIIALGPNNTPAVLTGAPFVSFTQALNILNINNITGLKANTLYTLRIVAWG